MSITTDKRQPAVIGGLIVGVLSALPIISVGNLCCCLWVVSGGVVAAYVLQQGQAEQVTAGDGAVIGFLAGLVGAVVYLVLSIPISILVEPIERALMQRVMDDAGTMPAGFRAYLESSVGVGFRVAIGFLFMLFGGSIFAAVGGVLGAIIFGKKSGLPAPGSGLQP